MVQGKVRAWMLRIAFSGKKHQHLLRAKDFFFKKIYLNLIGRSWHHLQESMFYLFEFKYISNTI